MTPLHTLDINDLWGLRGGLRCVENETLAMVGVRRERHARAGGAGGCVSGPAVVGALTPTPTSMGRPQAWGTP
jgi:hypothetical protein